MRKVARNLVAVFGAQLDPAMSLMEGATVTVIVGILMIVVMMLKMQSANGVSFYHNYITCYL